MPWLPPAAWAAVLFVLSAVPGDAYPSTSVDNADKMVHFGVYLVLGLLVARGLALTVAWAAWPIALAGAALATLYGMSDEFHQIFVPGRSADWYDVAADFAGAVVGAALLSGGRHLQSPRRLPVLGRLLGRLFPPPVSDGDGATSQHAKER